MFYQSGVTNERFTGFTKISGNGSGSATFNNSTITITASGKAGDDTIHNNAATFRSNRLDLSKLKELKITGKISYTASGASDTAAFYIQNADGSIKTSEQQLNRASPNTLSTLTFNVSNIDYGYIVNRTGLYNIIQYITEQITSIIGVLDNNI